LLATNPERQRACGYSAAKVATIRGIAQATVDGVVPTRDVAMALSDKELIERRSPLRGIGRWTVEMFLIYSLERSEILPWTTSACAKGIAGLKASRSPYAAPDA
jgi:DNA-3-methyladenine glycosylase II